MKYQKLTESESRTLADTVANKIRAIALTGRIYRPQEVRRSIRAGVMKNILAVRRTEKVENGGLNPHRKC